MRQIDFALRNKTFQSTVYRFRRWKIFSHLGLQKDEIRPLLKPLNVLASYTLTKIVLFFFDLLCSYWLRSCLVARRTLMILIL